MENVTIDLSLIWALIIAFGVFMYVLMDGFDLGVGILFPFAPDNTARDIMMNTVAPVWDGNETWLVLGGVGLLGAFPLVYSILLPALYLPILVMLAGLIFRGVAFEFRFKARRSRYLWDIAFAAGSMAATFAQGIVLGMFVQGFPVAETRFAGSAFTWLSPFNLMTGFGLMAGYALIGCSWLILKTQDHTQDWAYRRAPWLLLLVLLFIALVSLWTPFLHPFIEQRWFSLPNVLYLSPVPVVTVLLALLLLRALRRRQDMVPFFCSMGLFLLCYLGLAISLWPYLIIPDNVFRAPITIWDAAAAPNSQLFLLIGVLVIIPVILTYTAWTYWVFRGKVTRDSVGYH